MVFFKNTTRAEIRVVLRESKLELNDCSFVRVRSRVRVRGRVRGRVRVRDRGRGRGRVKSRVRGRGRVRSRGRGKTSRISAGMTQNSP